MHQAESVSASAALEKLKAGNKLFVMGDADQGDVSHEARQRSVQLGQSPYAIVVTCSDSRIVPEAVFSAGIGDLFVIRVAGNVVDTHQLGSIEYACTHLGTRLVVVMGHDHCGAIGAALENDSEDDPEGYINYIIDEVRRAIGSETDSLRASELNVRHAVSRIEAALEREVGASNGISVAGAMYCLATGEVRFL